MADLEFFIDPVCPWCWITSRWVKEVQRQRAYDVTWRFISLKMINEHRTEAWYTPEYRAGHAAGTAGLRVAAALRHAHGNDAVDAFYTELGTRIHPGGRGDDFRLATVELITESLTAASLPTELAAAARDESFDALLREETDLAFERTGKDVGTPIITFRPGTGEEASFFGPVIASIPRGHEATQLWDAIELIATSSGMAELKRSNRARPDFS